MVCVLNVEEPLFLNQAICAVIICIAAYAYGVSYRHIETISNQTQLNFVKLGREEASPAKHSFRTHPMPTNTSRHHNVTELFAMDFRWKLIRLCSAFLGAFGLVGLYSLLTSMPAKPARQRGLG